MVEINPLITTKDGKVICDGDIEETQISKRIAKDKDKLPYPDNCSIKVPPETKLKDFAKND